MKHKQILPKGFLTSKGNPTHKSLIMYMIYLKNLPVDWNIEEIHYPSVQKVRDFFGFNFGFDVMILWGIHQECGRSKTSSKRHSAMLKSYHDAKGLLAKGYKISYVNSYISSKN